MSASERRVLLSSWIRPSSQNEQDRQDRAERMIREAIKRHAPFADTKIEVYAKGSYPNNTNVRNDSDVDIVVECHDCVYYDYAQGVTTRAVSASAYSGPWTPQAWRTEVTRAVTDCFGPADVDATGSVALVVAAKPGSRPSTDVVPSFHYRKYWTGDKSRWDDGSVVYKADGGRIINWPQQQLSNGRAKNTATGKRYKSYARALKNAENYLADHGTIEPKPSYLMECLAWNVPDATLETGDLDAGFGATLAWLWKHLTTAYDYDYKAWHEPNMLKYLFGGGQKWDLADAKQIVRETWRLLDY
jgi:hypothetical protein